MNRFQLLPVLVAIGATGLLASCATTATQARLDAKTDTLLSAMSNKLAAAKTVRVHTARTSSAGFQAGVVVAESATGTVIVQRPNKLAAQVKTNRGARSIGFDGSTLTLVDHAAGTHATVKASGDLDSAVRRIHQTYGFMPPVAELLVNNPRAFLLEGVMSGRHAGTERVGGTECDRLDFRQEGVTWTLWVALADSLPRRLSISYPNGEGGAPLTVTVTLTNWALNAPVSASDFAVRLPTGSRALEMIPLHP